MKDFFIYIIRCNDGSYYTGHTDDIEKRIAQHHQGKIKCYTQNKHPLKIVFVQATSSRYEALQAERQIKKWSRAKKEALINGKWEKIQNLSKKIFKSDIKPLDTPVKDGHSGRTE